MSCASEHDEQGSKPFFTVKLQATLSDRKRVDRVHNVHICSVFPSPDVHFDHRRSSPDTSGRTEDLGGESTQALCSLGGYLQGLKRRRRLGST